MFVGVPKSAKVTCVCMYVCMYVCLCACAFMSVRVCLCVCVYVNGWVAYMLVCVFALG